MNNQLAPVVIGYNRGRQFVRGLELEENLTNFGYPNSENRNETGTKPTGRFVAIERVGLGYGLGINNAWLNIPSPIEIELSKSNRGAQSRPTEGELRESGDYDGEESVWIRIKESGRTYSLLCDSRHIV